MSEKINIENSIYEFSAILIATNVAADGSKETKTVPLNKSSIRYLEIEDNLANIGIVGKIIISNYYGILQKLNIYNATNESPYIFIRFKNLDFVAAGASIIPEVFVMAALGKSSETSTNIIDRHVAFEFEEKSIVTLKREYISTPSERDALAGTSPEEAISDIFTVFCNEILQKKEEDIKPSAAESIPSIIFKKGDSAYDIVRKCYDHLAYEPAYNGIYSPGLIQLENVEGKLERKLVIKSLAEDMTAFFKIIKSGGDASKYLNDKFTVTFSDKTKFLRDNIITKYDIMRVDYEEVFEKKWSNLSKTAGDTDVTNTDFIPYTALREAFGQLFTSPYDSNLPQRDPERIRILTYHYPGDLNSSTTTSWATNKTLRSFIYDNVAIVFKVKGQPYRVPGKFIRINTDQPTEANKTSSSSSSCAKTSTDESVEADSLNGWWYVISVQHIFENDIYFNRIVAVKIYSPVEIPNLNYGLIADNGGAAGTTGASRGTGGDGGSGSPPGNFSNLDYIGEDFNREVFNAPGGISSNEQVVDPTNQNPFALPTKRNLLNPYDSPTYTNYGVDKPVRAPFVEPPSDPDPDVLPPLPN